MARPNLFDGLMTTGRGLRGSVSGSLGAALGLVAILLRPVGSVQPVEDGEGEGPGDAPPPSEGIAVEFGAHPVHQLQACNPIFSARSIPEFHAWLLETA